MYTEILPLVEFHPEDDIDAIEAERLLMAPPKSNATHPDPFTDTMVHEESSDLMPFSLDREALRSMDPAAVLIAKWPAPLATRYYRNLLPDLQVNICPECLQVRLYCDLINDSCYDLECFRLFMQRISRCRYC